MPKADSEHTPSRRKFLGHLGDRITDLGNEVEADFKEYETLQETNS